MPRKSLSVRLRFEILKRDGFRCTYCGRQPPEVVLHVDHVKAVAGGGDNRRGNLRTACVECNQGKHVAPVHVHPPLRSSDQFNDLAAWMALDEARSLGMEIDWYDVMEMRRYAERCNGDLLLDAIRMAAKLPIDKPGEFLHAVSLCLDDLGCSGKQRP